MTMQSREHTDYVSRHRELKDGLRSLHHAIAPTMGGFGDLHRAAMAPGAIDTATKELIALAIGITSHCDGCVVFHVHDALAAGATPEQVKEAIGVAIMMGGGPAAIFGSEALAALEQFEPNE